MKVFLQTIGCRLNQSEIETMARQLLAAGHEIVTDTAVAHKVIINTCAVTAAAARDGRTLTRRIYRQNSDADILLTGCYATTARRSRNGHAVRKGCTPGRPLSSVLNLQMREWGVLPHTLECYFGRAGFCEARARRGERRLVRVAD